MIEYSKTNVYSMKKPSPFVQTLVELNGRNDWKSKINSRPFLVGNKNVSAVNDAV